MAVLLAFADPGGAVAAVPSPGVERVRCALRGSHDHDLLGLAVGT